jgi:hypothetical protein
LRAQKLRSPCFRVCVRLYLAAPGVTPEWRRDERRGGAGAEEGKGILFPLLRLRLGSAKELLPSLPRVRFASILHLPDGEEGEGRALRGIQAVGIVSGLMEAETARPTVALNAADNGHYGEQKHS